MSQSIITLQLNSKIKEQLKKKSSNMGVSLSEYIRDLIEIDIGVKPSIDEKNPWLELSDNVNVELTQVEIEDMFKNIETNRKSRSFESWKKIAENLK